MLGVRGGAAVAPGRGFPGAAGAGWDPRGGGRRCVRGGRFAGRPSGQPRRGASGPHRGARRGESRGMRARGDGLVPARGPRPARDGRRRDEGDRAGTRVLGSRSRRGRGREGHRGDPCRRCAGVVPDRRADAHVAPDRGGVPELPAAAARDAREPADGLAPAAPGRGPSRRALGA